MMVSPPLILYMDLPGGVEVWARAQLHNIAINTGNITQNSLLVYVLKNAMKNGTLRIVQNST